MEKEKKEGLQKIQAMNQEIRDLKTKLNDFEANKAKEIKKLEDSLTDSLKSNKKAQETLDHEKVVISEVEGSKKKLLDEISTLKKDKQKVDKRSRSHPRQGRTRSLFLQKGLSHHVDLLHHPMEATTPL